ncbi:uncharacterized protein [Scyliorhinus torazame]|uniref:uncharacterized protein isoform X3 n=2 Tax=Scyliorhinus torazame TaxID=75743 RepID=UPI003B5CB0A9
MVVPGCDPDPAHNRRDPDLQCSLQLFRSNPLSPLGSSCDSERQYYDEELRECCGKCPPGSFAMRRCSKLSATQCESCPPGEFTAYWNYIRKCNLCPSCDHRRGLEVSRNCTSQRKTECQCREGYHCLQGLECTECEMHTECPAGYQVAQPGSHRVNTMCSKCPPGTFQNEKSLSKCRKQTICAELGLTELQPGSRESDSVCGGSTWMLGTTQVNDLLTTSINQQTNSLHFSYVLIIVLLLTILSCGFLAGFLAFVRSDRHCRGSKEHAESQNSGEDRSSLESKVPLLASGKRVADCRDPHIQAQPHPRLDNECLGQMTAGLQQEREVLTQHPAHSSSSPSDRWGEQNELRPSLSPQPADPEPGPRPQQHSTFGEQPGGVCGAHGLVGLQGCQVQSFESNLTVNGPLYIYNGQMFPGPTGAGHQQQEDQHDPHRGHQETGSAPGHASVPEEAAPYHVRTPVAEENSGHVDTQPVQEDGCRPGVGQEASNLVKAEQEEGKESHGPAQEEPSWRRSRRLDGGRGGGGGAWTLGEPET